MSANAQNAIDHYCIQAQRIVRIEDKLDNIDAKIDRLSSVDGTVGKMSGQLERLTALIESGNTGRKQLGADIWKWFGLSVLVLAVIIATLLGIKIPL